jgi:hypothetical protein
VRIQIDPDAAAFIAMRGGHLWVWAARPRMCCSGAPAWMRAATAEPAGIFGFMALQQDAGVQVHFRPTAGLAPDVLEIGLQGRRNPRVEAYWDGCLMAMV